ncbi:MAG: SAM-dependent methyltransferase [Desulfobacterales bacterium]|nr:SAM-dependent methyltransferase [Desulfobacterales bacterium]
MFQGLRSIVYKVPDIEKAKNWYSKVFDTKPILDTSFAMFFSIGDSSLGLIPDTNTTIKSDDSVTAYWEVDDIDSEYTRLLKLGATPHTEISFVFNIKRATVIDPFGNILGIRTAAVDANKVSVEQQPSQTAMGVAAARAVSAIDEREEIKGHDYLAEIFLSDDLKTSLKEPAMLKEKISRMPGMYEYIIARTAYFDHIAEQALRENIPQIVFLGAGYDTRPYRFKDLIKDTRIFELDIHTTQQHKMKLLHQKNIPIPGQLTFVPINFNTETLEDVLFKAGYRKDQKNIFIWEGVTYYLSSKAVDDTLSFIKSTSSVGSTVCFDYSAFWPEMLNAYGVRKLMETMRTNYSGEAARFGIERGKIESFLSDRGYKIIDHLTAEDMEIKFLTLRDGSLAGKVIGHFCFARASISG